MKFHSYQLTSSREHATRWEEFGDRCAPRRYLEEAINAHMTHLEDLVFIQGVSGTRRAINFLIDIQKMLAGSSDRAVDVGVKWDGSPAVVAGVDPSDGQFFVAKKSIFNKTPKIYKSVAEVNTDTSGDLAVKLSIAYESLKPLAPSKGIFQGDMMFTKGDVKTQTINGDRYVTFHPNTIVYAVPAGTDAAADVLRARMGIVWHTTYTGAIGSLSAKFGGRISSLWKQSASVWMQDASLPDVSGLATFTAAETAEIDGMLSDIGTEFRSVKPGAFNDIADNPELLQLVLTYNNSMIRSGKAVIDMQAHVTGLRQFIRNRFAALPKSDKNQDKFDDIDQYFSKYSQSMIASVFDISYKLAAVKDAIVRKLNQVSSIGTFVATKDGFRAADPEGYVAIDQLTGNAVKIVNRMSFSRANFDPDIIKGWQHP